MSKRPSKRPKTKKQSGLKASFTAKNSGFVLQGIAKLHVGKRVLISAEDLYEPDLPPDGQENTLFQYSVKHINPDCKTAVIDYDEIQIEDGGDEFQDNPELEHDSSLIDDYDLSRLTEDHEKFNEHLARWNKRRNDAEEQRKKEMEVSKSNLTDTLSDLQKLFNEGTEVCDLLLGEFETATAVVEHKIKKAGKNFGKINHKQDWSKYLC